MSTTNSASKASFVSRVLGSWQTPFQRALGWGGLLAFAGGVILATVSLNRQAEAKKDNEILVMLGGIKYLNSSEAMAWGPAIGTGVAIAIIGGLMLLRLYMIIRSREASPTAT